MANLPSGLGGGGSDEINTGGDPGGDAYQADDRDDDDDNDRRRTNRRSGGSIPGAPRNPAGINTGDTPAENYQADSGDSGSSGGSRDSGSSSGQNIGSTPGGSVGQGLETGSDAFSQSTVDRARQREQEVLDRFSSLSEDDVIVRGGNDGLSVTLTERGRRRVSDSSDISATSAIEGSITRTREDPTAADDSNIQTTRNTVGSITRNRDDPTGDDDTFRPTIFGGPTPGSGGQSMPSSPSSSGSIDRQQQREQFGDFDWSFGLGGPEDEVERTLGSLSRDYDRFARGVSVVPGFTQDAVALERTGLNLLDATAGEGSSDFLRGISGDDRAGPVEDLSTSVGQGIVSGLNPAAAARQGLETAEFGAYAVNEVSQGRGDELAADTLATAGLVASQSRASFEADPVSSSGRFAGNLAAGLAGGRATATGINRLSGGRLSGSDLTYRAIQRASDAEDVLPPFRSRLVGRDRGQVDLSGFAGSSDDTVTLGGDDLDVNVRGPDDSDALEQRVRQMEIRIDRRQSREAEQTLADEPVEPDVRTADVGVSGGSLSPREYSTANRGPRTTAPDLQRVGDARRASSSAGSLLSPRESSLFATRIRQGYLEGVPGEDLRGAGLIDEALEAREAAESSSFIGSSVPSGASDAAGVGTGSGLLSGALSRQAEAQETGVGVTTGLASDAVAGQSLGNIPDASTGVETDVSTRTDTPTDVDVGPDILGRTATGVDTRLRTDTDLSLRFDTPDTDAPFRPPTRNDDDRRRYDFTSNPPRGRGRVPWPDLDSGGSENEDTFGFGGEEAQVSFETADLGFGGDGDSPVSEDWF
ncbi:hypothetical protein [Halogeometricum luteum]|uniref:Uncharacterized protein n=1 Tax=Halogeometricum luteum TaxID=2950537 RepID=A0ABU2GA10_9EURY|nr:hypothetical protein [Halogeometricum sp. S3BR5-2]MDS0297103.1 hypothetical protein [Halogeometricum sp. S3BR5-2]